MSVIKIKDKNSEKLAKEMAKNKDINSARINRLLNLPDLTRAKNSPIRFVVDAVFDIPLFKDFDTIDVPEIVSVDDNFNLLNTPPGHPSRQKTDTYYLNKDYLLRTQTTVMWSFYLKDKNTVNKLEKTGELKGLCYGKVFRKDEIDRHHYPVFHQIDGLYICEKSKKQIGINDLKDVLLNVARGIYGSGAECRFSEDSFPFTDPSIELEIKIGDRWLEVLGAGIVHTKVLENFGIDSKLYNGWAFGFGLERLAMLKMNIPDIRIFWSTDKRVTRQFKNLDSQYEEVSKFPMIYRDISFVVDKGENLNRYHEVVRDYANDLVEEVRLLDKYENADKFGEGKISYTFRIIYRSCERTLTSEEINEIQGKIISALEEKELWQVRKK